MEEKEKGQPAQPAAPAPDQGTQVIATPSSGLQSTLAAISGLKGIDTDSIAKAVESISQPAMQQQQQQQPPAAATAQPPAATDRKDTPPANEPGAQVEDNSVLSQLGLGKAPKTESDLPEFVKTDDFKAFVKQKFGVNDPSTLIEKSIPEWRKGAQEAAEFKKKVTAMETLFEKMPEELYEAVQAWSQGKDYRKVIEDRPKIDLTADPKKVEPKKLVDQYFPNQFTAEEWEEYNSGEPSPQLKKAIDIAISQGQEKLAFDQQRIRQMRADAQTRVAEETRLFNESVSRSVSNLKSQLPDIADSLVTDIEKDLTSGGYKNLLYDDKGQYTDDAAYRIMLMKIGHELIQATKNKVEAAAVSKAREDILVTVPAAAQPVGTPPQGNQLSKGVEDFLKSVVPQTKRNHY